MMEGKKKKSSSRLFQLAINDALRSQWNLVLPIRKLKEEDKIENRKNKCINSNIPIQTESSSSVSSDVFTSKHLKKTENGDTAYAFKNEYVKEVSNSSKSCQVRDAHTSIPGYKKDYSSRKNTTETSFLKITCSLDNSKRKVEIFSPKAQKFSSLNDFESPWIPKENGTFFDVSEKDQSSINSNLMEKKEIKSLNSRKSIDYDLPVFQLNDNESTIQGPSQRSSFDCNLVFPVLQTPGSEFFQESEVLNNFIPPPRIDVEYNMADEQEILAPYMCDKTVSQSCNSLGYPKYIEKETKKYSSESILCGDIFENFSKDSDSPLFDQCSTFKHFERMLSESSTSGSSESVIETNITDYYSHMCYPFFKAHPVDYLLCKDSNEQLDQNPDNTYMDTESSFNENLSGLLKHFPEFKSVI